MNDNGWISLHRKIRNSRIWDFDNPKMTLAWIDLLMMVNHEPEDIRIGGKTVHVKRGETVTSIRKLAARWHVDRRTAKRWLDKMMSHKMAQYYSTTKYTTVSIENYSFYQGKRDNDGTSDGTSDGTQTISINKLNKDVVSAEGKAFSSLLSDSDWEKLDERYEDLDELIDYLDDAVVDPAKVHKPYSYACSIADRHGWAKKGKAKFDWAKEVR